MTQLYQDPVELVCAAARHLITQGRPGAEISATGRVSCRYVAPDGTRCALGGLLPATESPHRESGRSFNGVLVTISGLTKASDRWDDLAAAAEQIQAVHDEWALHVASPSAINLDRLRRKIEDLDDAAPGWREAMSDDLPRFFALIGHETI